MDVFQSQDKNISTKRYHTVNKTTISIVGAILNKKLGQEVSYH